MYAIPACIWNVFDFQTGEFCVFFPCSGSNDLIYHLLNKKSTTPALKNGVKVVIDGRIWGSKGICITLISNNLSLGSEAFQCDRSISVGIFPYGRSIGLKSLINMHLFVNPCWSSVRVVVIRDKNRTILYYKSIWWAAKDITYQIYRARKSSSEYKQWHV